MSANDPKRTFPTSYYAEQAAPLEEDSIATCSQARI